MPYAQSMICTQTLNLEGPEPQVGLMRDWISNLPASTGAQRFAELARGHWDIENGSHRQRDVLWGEDRQLCKNHNRAHVLATLRQVALCLHHTEVPQRLTHGRKRLPISHQAQILSRSQDKGISLILGST
jgi:hypothetical protein